MTEIQGPSLSAEGRKTMYWAVVARSVSEGLPSHKRSGQLVTEKDPTRTKIKEDGEEIQIPLRLVIGKKVVTDKETGEPVEKDKTGVERPWGNITELCLVQVARTELLGKLVGLPDDVVADAKLGSFLHNINKKDEITVTREANRAGTSPLAAVKPELAKTEAMLREAEFSERIQKFASAPRGYAPQLLECQRILDEGRESGNISNDDLAYLIVHYVSDLATGKTGTDWVRPSHAVRDDKRVNAVDYRAEENKRKPAYRKIAREIEQELEGSPLEGMNTFDAMAQVSHQIEERLAQRILEQTGEGVDPLEIPELVDQEIRKKN